MVQKRLLPILFLVWSLFVLIYLLKTYPVRIPSENFVLDDVFFLLILFLVVTAFGQKMLGYLRLPSLGYDLTLLFGVMLGTGFLSLLLFLLGLVGFYRLPTFLVLLAFFAVISYEQLTMMIKKMGQIRLHFSGIEGIMIGGIALTVFQMMFLALTPPTKRDELIHHLAYPKLFLERGEIFDLSFSTFSYYPMGLDLLYGLAMAFTSDIAARLLHVMIGLISLFGLYLLARKIFDRTFSLLATLIFASLPLVVYTSGKAYVDMGIVLYLLGALHAFLCFKEKGNVSFLLLCGLFLGFCFGAKYNAMLFFPVFVFGHLWMVARQMKPKQVIKQSLWLIVPLLLAISPWMIRNTILMGNPLFPYYNHLFHGKELMPDQPTLSELQFRVYDQGWIAQFLIPWLVSVEMTGEKIYARDGIIGPILLIFVPFAFLRREKPWLFHLLVQTVLTYFVLAWFMGGLRLRYYLPMFPMLSILATEGIRIVCDSRWLRWLAVSVLTLLIGYNMIVSTTYVHEADPWPFLTGKMDRKAYLDRHVFDMPYMTFMNERLPFDAHVMLIYSNRGYYLNRAYRYDAKFSGYTFKQILRHSQTPKEMTARFQNLGITHLYIDLEGLNVDLQNDPLGQDREKVKLLEMFFNQEIKTLFVDKRVLIARLLTGGNDAKETKF